MGNEKDRDSRKMRHPDWNWEYWEAQLEGFSQKAKNDCEE